MNMCGKRKNPHFSKRGFSFIRNIQSSIRKRCAYPGKILLCAYQSSASTQGLSPQNFSHNDEFCPVQIFALTINTNSNQFNRNIMVLDYGYAPNILKAFLTTNYKKYVVVFCTTPQMCVLQ